MDGEAEAPDSVNGGAWPVDLPPTAHSEPSDSQQVEGSQVRLGSQMEGKKSQKVPSRSRWSPTYTSVEVQSSLHFGQGESRRLLEQGVRQGWKYRSQAAAVVKRRELRPQKRGRESGRAPVGLSRPCYGLYSEQKLQVWGLDSGLVLVLCPCSEWLCLKQNRGSEWVGRRLGGRGRGST